ncbi:MAG: RNA polymerase sigma factor [Steroidobacteraceae bacterium]
MNNPEKKRLISDWFSQWRVPLRKFLSGRSSVAAADLDDIAQEVFLRLLRYERSELVEHPQAYLFKMAANVASEWSIRARRRHPHDSKWLDSLLTDDVAEDHAIREQSQQEMQRALNTLSARQRMVLELQYAEGLGYAEIAERLGTTPRSVKRAIATSYEKLRLELKSELPGVGSHGRE